MTLAEQDEFFTQSKKILQEADCLYTAAEVESAVKCMADKINERLKESYPLVITVLNGGLIPAGMILPKLKMTLQMDYLHASRYGLKTAGEELHWFARPKTDLKNRTVLLIDDIHDEGVTLQQIVEFCQIQGAKQVLSCVLTHKNHDRKASPAADFSALELPDRYVFGCGMDYKSLFRNEPCIYAVKGL